MSAAREFTDLRELYQGVILDRSRNPRHMHALDPCDARASGDNPMCGDEVDVRLRLSSDLTITDAAFEARGCAISMASADLMSEVVRGRSAHEVRDLAEKFETLVRTGDTQVQDAALEKLRPLSGVSEYRSRVKCATLPWHALIAALDGARAGVKEVS